MRAIDADAFADYIKKASLKQKYENLKIDELLTVADVLDAVVAELDGSGLDGYKNAPTIEPEPHWIPCSERLPDTKGYVLVTDYGETDMGRRFCDKWWLDCCGDKMKDVTAWMPLPEPYREGG